MNREIQRKEREHFTEYARELAEKFNEGILHELTPYKQFIVWRYQEAERGKKKKPPYNPATHYPASPNDPKTWGTYKDALKALSTGLYNGIGFVFTEQDPFIGIDLDHCVHLNRRVDKQAQEIISDLSTYTEYSPRDGAHLLIKAQAPFTTRKLGDIELFASGHTLSLTLQSIPGTPSSIEERQDELNTLLLTFDAQRGESENPTLIWQRPCLKKSGVQAQRHMPERLTEVENRLIERWKKEPGNFARYFEGDSTLWTGSKRRVNSKSEADFVLCLMLLSRTHDNTEQVKRLFHSSGLFDPIKTDRPSGRDFVTREPVTYLEMTIFNALKKRPKQG